MESAWQSYVAALSNFKTQAVPYSAELLGVGVPAFTLLLALSNAFFLKHALRFDVHTFRLYATLMVLTLGE